MSIPESKTVVRLETSKRPTKIGDEICPRRLVPDDTYQGKIIAERMINDGIKIIVPLWRSDIYGNELYNSTKSNFERLGGKVEVGINYQL